MFLLIVILLAVLVATYFTPVFKGGNATWVRIGLCALLAVLSVVRCSSGRTDSPAAKAQDRHNLVGWKLGTAMSGDIPGGGRVVVLQMYPAHEGITELNASQIRGLEKGAGSLFNFQPLEQENTGNPLGVSRETFAALQDSARDAAAVVSFLPLPLRSMDLDQWPPLYLYDGMGTKYWKKAFDKGAVKAVIHPVNASDRKLNKTTGAPDDRFAATYQLTTSK